MAAAKLAQEPPNTRLSVGDYIADILLDARPNGSLYRSGFVQRVGSAAIIHWGQEYTFEDAYSAVTLLFRASGPSQQAKKPNRRLRFHL